MQPVQLILAMLTLVWTGLNRFKQVATDDKSKLKIFENFDRNRYFENSKISVKSKFLPKFSPSSNFFRSLTKTEVFPKFNENRAFSKFSRIMTKIEIFLKNFTKIEIFRNFDQNRNFSKIRPKSLFFEIFEII